MQIYKPSSIKFLIFGVAIITLYFNTKVADPFNTVKLIILLLVSGWLLGHLISSYREHPIKAKTADLSPIVLCVAFVLTLTISTFFTDQVHYLILHLLPYLLAVSVHLLFTLSLI
jgi:hypothetical protein